MDEPNPVWFEFELSLGEARSHFLLKYQLEIPWNWEWWVRAHLHPWPLSSEEGTYGAARLLLTSSWTPFLREIPAGNNFSFVPWWLASRKTGVINLCTPANVLPSSPAWLQQPLPAHRKVAGFISVVSLYPIVLPTYNRIITTSHKNGTDQSFCPYLFLPPCCFSSYSVVFEKVFL